jgi:hypothetical protein
MLNASGGEVKHHGKKYVSLLLDAGNEARVRFQLLDVTKPILSVGELNDAGNDVIFTKRGSCIKRGDHSIQVLRRNGIFFVRAKLVDRNARVQQTIMQVESEEATTADANKDDHCRKQDDNSAPVGRGKGQACANTLAFPSMVRILRQKQSKRGPPLSS